MAYTKQTWANGDVITADKLNHMEDGIESVESAMFLITLEQSGDNYTIDKTMAEIMSAYNSGLIPVVKYGNNFLYLLNEYNEESEGAVMGFGGITQINFGININIIYTNVSIVDEGDEYGTYVPSVDTITIPASSEP